MTTAPRLARYYEQLAWWSRIAGLVGFDGGRGALTIHRALADPGAAGRPTTRRVHDLVRAHLPARRPLAVLDAGCGYGGTMVDLARALEGRFHGLTLSPRQAAVGAAAIGRAGLGTRVSIECRSYDTPPSVPVDAVIAIESLAHSPDPARSLAALAPLLSVGGRFVIVDDMPEATAAGDPDLALLKHGWQCPVLWTRAELLAAFDRHGLALVAEQDLTPALRPREPSTLSRLEHLNRLAHRLVGADGWRMLMDAHRGGLALERLYRSGAMRYRLLVAERR